MSTALASADDTLLDKHGEPVVRGRMRPALIAAIKLIEEEGYAVADAAKAVGYRTHSLTQAMCKPHVRAFRIDVRRAWRLSQTSMAWVTVARLASKAASEDVQLKAARFLIEQDQAARAKMPEQARQLVQIIAQGPVNLGQLPSGQLPGVFETPPLQAIEGHASNSRPVGRDESDEEEG